MPLLRKQVHDISCRLRECPSRSTPFSYASRAPRSVSISDTSATGTSHQDSPSGTRALRSPRSRRQSFANSGPQPRAPVLAHRECEREMPLAPRRCDRDEINVYPVSSNISVFPKLALRPKQSAKNGPSIPSHLTYGFFTNLVFACAAVTRHVDAKNSFPEGVGSHPVLKSKNARKRMRERPWPHPRRTLEVQLQCELDFTRIARSARIGA